MESCQGIVCNLDPGQDVLGTVFPESSPCKDNLKERSLQGSIESDGCDDCLIRTRNDKRIQGKNMGTTLQQIAIPNDPGNSFGTAFNLGTLDCAITLEESININDSGDLDDFYRFDIESPQTVEILVDGVSQKLDVDFLNGPSFNSRVFLSETNPSESLSETVILEPGTYYLKVFTFNRLESDYQVTLTPTPLPTIPPPPPQPPPSLPVPTRGRVDFRDDFNGTSLDRSLWELPEPGDSSFLGRTQFRLDEDPAVANGIARLQLDTFNPTALMPGDSFLGSEIQTIQMFDRPSEGGLAFEARVRVASPLERGMVASLFSFTIRDGDGDGDITVADPHDEIGFEFLTNSIDNALQNSNTNPTVLTNVFADDPLGAGDGEFVPVPDSVNIEEFNTFRIEWLPDRVRWFINDVAVREEIDTVPDEAMDIRLNFWAPAPEFPQAFDGSLQPASNEGNNETFFYDVDFVQIESILPDCETLPDGCDPPPDCETLSDDCKIPLCDVRLDLALGQLLICLPDFPAPNPNTEPLLGGSDADDFLLGNTNANFIAGLGGRDTLAGLEGNDNLSGDDGDDLIFGNQGIDRLDGGNGNDSLFGSQGDDALLGGANDDILVGEIGADRLDGNDGNDLIFGNLGNDSIDGGSGNDLIFAGQNDDLAKGGSQNDVMMGDFGNDTLDGETENDILFGNIGFDILDGDEGDDLLFGGREDDIVIGGAGNDVVNGDRGNDTLIGGPEGDRFDFRAGDGSDFIADFTDGADLIGLKDGLMFEQLTIVQAGNDTQITTSGLLITLPGVNVSQIDASDFAII